MKRNIIFLFVILVSHLIGINQAVAQVSQLKDVTAVCANEFLNSIGVCVHVQHGQDASKLAPLLKYTGIRNVRDGADRNYNMTGLILLHQQAGIHIVIGPGSGARDVDIQETLTMAHKLHTAGALIAIEGPNEPNNFGGVTYQGEKSGVTTGTWMPVAKFQRDLYNAVKSDPVLKKYPVFSASEMGAETDNVGLQFLTIPTGTNCLMPDGTKYADYLNVHNYMYHEKMWPGAPHDNQVWNAADLTSACKADGIYNNHGLTWRKQFTGYSEADLLKLPKVTTETGIAVGALGGTITEEVQANNYMNVFLDQFKRGYTYTFIYEFLDDPDGAYGFYKIDYTTGRKSATYLHNLTSILDDDRSVTTGKLNYSIPNARENTHDLLLQKSNGKFYLVVWCERVAGSDNITINFGKNYGSINLFDPTSGITAIRTFNNVDSLDLEMSDHPVIIEIDK
jgi:hypothetical protein